MSRLHLSSRSSLHPQFQSPLVYRQVVLNRNGHRTASHEQDGSPSILRGRQSVPHAAMQRLNKLQPIRSHSNQQHYLSEPKEASSTALMRTSPV